MESLIEGGQSEKAQAALEKLKGTLPIYGQLNALRNIPDSDRQQHSLLCIH